MIPEAYIKAKKLRAPKTRLMAIVEAMCLEALQEDAASKGLPKPKEASPSLVSLTYDMYEYALSLGDAGNE